MNFRFTSAALRELQEAAFYYDQVENGLGGRFLDEVEETLRRIFANPCAWKAFSMRTRRCRTHRFPFGLLYEIKEAQEILILAVMDLRRDPKRWCDLL